VSGLRDRLSRLDPRALQIVALGTFLGFGVLMRDFSVQWQQVGLTFAAALATQAFWLRRLDLRQAGYLSAIVTGFGLSVLVRADSLWAHPMIAALAISSKFVVRIDGRHLFNPANLGAVLAAWLVPGAWLSPGQWGSDLAASAWFLALGTLVTQRSRRIDAGWCFLAFFVALCGLRVLVLGQPAQVLVHQAGSGALLLFGFFMISDPMTTPLATRARVGFAALVALVAFAWQYALFMPHALVTALFVLAPLVPWLNRRVPAAGFAWRENAPPAPADAVTRCVDARAR
jgi:Na+-transporting NADH:ubiquinone oxidoreductase subunit NqrB